MQTPNMNKRAVQEGALALLEGKKANENPYRHGSQSHRRWILGFQTQGRINILPLNAEVTPEVEKPKKATRKAAPKKAPVIKASAKKSVTKTAPKTTKPRKVAKKA